MIPSWKGNVLPSRWFQNDFRHRTDGGERMKSAIVESLEPRISNSVRRPPKGQRFPAQVASPSFFPFPPPQNTLSLGKAEEAEKKGKSCFNKRGRLFSFFLF